jgi:hypothetical protein
MKHANKIGLFIFLNMLGFNAIAQSASENLVTELTACSPSFFSYIHKNEKILSKYAPVEQKTDFSHFKVRDRTALGEASTVFFSKPVAINGLKLLGYTDSVMDGTVLNIGMYYSWGLIIEGSPQKLKDSLKQINWQNPEPNIYIGNPQMIRSVKNSLQWENTDEILSGTVPTQGTVEKVLIIESQTPNKSTITCNIQGSVTEELLKQERPDL